MTQPSAPKSNFKSQRYYGTYGDRVLVEPRKESDSKADWRFAMFSIVFPLNCRVEREFFADNPLWVRGRFEGVRELSQGSSRYLARSFYQSQKSWLSKRISESLAAGGDEEQENEPAPAQGWTYHLTLDRLHDMGPAANSELHSSHLSEATSYLTLIRKQLADVERCSKDDFGWVRIDSEPVSNPEEAEWRGEFRLQGCEYLSFGGQEAFSEPDCLVLHVTARHLTRDLLEDLSQSLHRTRTHLRRECLQNELLATAKDKNFRPLPEFLTVINSTLAAGEGTVVCVLRSHKSGAVTAQGCSGTDHTSLVHRCVLAIPNVEKPRPPELLDSDGEDVPTGRTEVADGWAWVLASGADKYFSGLPHMGDEGLTGLRLGWYQNWSVMSAELGVAAVRLNTHYEDDSKTTMLISTRFVDLALLNLKSLVALRKLNAELEFHEAPRDTEDLQEAGEKSLTQRLTHLQSLQMRLVDFRDRHWFQAVPKREMGSRILLGFRRGSGAQQMYEDIVDEIVLRERTYTTMFQVENARIQEERSVEAAREECRRNQEREEKEKERERSEEARRAAEEDRELLNITLAAGALLLALPTLFIDLFGMPPGVMTTLLVAGVFIALFVAWRLWQQSRKRRRGQVHGNDR